MKKTIKILVIVGIMTCTALCSLFLITNSNSASATNASEINTLCETYTSTKIPNGININDYVDGFKNRAGTDSDSNNWKRYGTQYTTVTVISQNGDYFQNNNIFSRNGNSYVITYIDGDDNITKIVSKELFTYENERLWIGDAFGFYINTIEKETTAGNKYFESTVILIDVIRENLNDYAFALRFRPSVKSSILVGLI